MISNCADAEIKKFREINNVQRCTTRFSLVSRCETRARRLNGIRKTFIYNVAEAELTPTPRIEDPRFNWSWTNVIASSLLKLFLDLDAQFCSVRWKMLEENDISGGRKRTARREKRRFCLTLEDQWNVCRQKFSNQFPECLETRLNIIERRVHRRGT